MNISIDRFGDIQLHAASVQEWKQTYSQLTSGSLQSSLQQLSGERFQIFLFDGNGTVEGVAEFPRSALARVVNTPPPPGDFGDVGAVPACGDDAGALNPAGRRVPGRSELAQPALLGGVAGGRACV